MLWCAVLCCRRTRSVLATLNPWLHWPCVAPLLSVTLAERRPPAEARTCKGSSQHVLAQYTHLACKTSIFVVWSVCCAQRVQLLKLSESLAVSTKMACKPCQQECCSLPYQRCRVTSVTGVTLQCERSMSCQQSLRVPAKVRLAHSPPGQCCVFLGTAY
jgi:hypothetical protein